MDSEEIDKWDEESERAWQHDNHNVQFAESIVATLKEILPSKARILDVGCGIGKHVKAFRELGYFVVGIDQSKKAIEYARCLNPYHRHLYQIRIQELDFRNRFDLIHTCAVLQHSTHERKITILQKFREALKPKGYYLCAECTFTPETMKKVKQILKLPSNEYSEDWTDGYSFTENYWIKFMAQNGFKHIKTIPPWPYYLYEVVK